MLRILVEGVKEALWQKEYKVATIAGDGIGLEVLPEGIKVVKAAAEKHGIELQLDAFRLGKLRLLP